MWTREQAARRKQKDRERRIQVIQHYSQGVGCCACCGESHIEFLGIDHIDGGGNKHRKEVQNHYRNIYWYLIKNNYPDGYRVLCHNCNLARGFYGYCPHTKQESEGCLECSGKLRQGFTKN